MDYTIYGMVCLFFGAIIGFFFGLAVHVPPEPTTSGAVYDAMSEPEPPAIHAQVDRIVAAYLDDEQARG